MHTRIIVCDAFHKNEIAMNILEYETYQERRIHGEFEFPYNTYLCSIPLDFNQVPLHWHDEMELIYVKKGQGVITVDFKTHRVKGPTLVMILPGQLHSISQYDVVYPPLAEYNLYHSCQ